MDITAAAAEEQEEEQEEEEEAANTAEDGVGVGVEEVAMEETPPAAPIKRGKGPRRRIFLI